MDLSPLYHGLFLDYLAAAIPLTVLALLVIGYNGWPLLVWTIVGFTALWGFGAPVWLLGAFLVINLIFLLAPVRRVLVSKFVMKTLAPIMPKISDSERQALEAGVTWIEKDLFSGSPDFKKILSEPYPSLTAEEKAFMDGPVQELCGLVDAWEVWKSKELDDKIWACIRKHKFLGMIIPKENGGLGFSALAHSEVVQKVASRSISACITIMVPNSLGPAELVLHYGTKEQKDYLLPRLARGEEIPCFALTEPGAGSDAGSISSSGELYRGEDGQLYIKLNWNKRWITLAAISTIVGMAFRLRDPKNILGHGEDVGITCAMIPAKTPGVILGRRHDPMGVPFYNCPTQGKDVVIPVSMVVGGIEGCGKGWGMLMECLAAGRGISLPAQAVGGSKLISRVTSAHATIRQQFGVSIGKFEGVEEPLARIFGHNYGLEAMRRYVVGALDKGIKPGVITAMAKYYATELGRSAVADGMDVMGGAGISMGPRNLLAEIYIGTPIGITVEGANIMTRTLIIFGQGALRSHPYAFKEVDSIIKGDLVAFDAAFWGHIGFVVKNMCRSIGLSVTRGYIASSPVSGPTAIFYRRLQWASASFAIMADIAMGALGGDLKLREKITGRFADILAWMFIGSATLRRYEAEGRKPEDLIFVQYMLKKSLFEIQKSFDGLFDNIKVPGLVWFFKGWIGTWSRINSIGSQASDGHGHRLVKAFLSNSALRERHTEGIYIPKDRHQQLARLDYAHEMVLKSEAIEKKVRDAVKSKVLAKRKMGPELLDDARSKNVITVEELKILKEVVDLRWDAIQVDDFSQEQYHAQSSRASLNAVG